MLKKIVLATTVAIGMTCIMPSFADSINLHIGTDQWQDWRWREAHPSEWSSWRHQHNQEWMEWRSHHRNDWKRWCYHHPDDCKKYRK